MLDFEITPEQLASLKDKKEVVLLDVREPWEFDAARIEGSLLMPMGDIPYRVFQELDPEDHIITICHHGVRSMNVAVWLRNQGIRRGAIPGWRYRCVGGKNRSFGSTVLNRFHKYCVRTGKC